MSARRQQTAFYLFNLSIAEFLLKTEHGQSLRISGQQKMTILSIRWQCIISVNQVSILFQAVKKHPVKNEMRMFSPNIQLFQGKFTVAIVFSRHNFGRTRQMDVQFL